MNYLVVGASCGFGGYAAYQLFTSGLSDTLGLHTLRHGTSLVNWVGIQLLGARPDFGGIMPGETRLEGYYERKTTVDRFFVWRDDFHEEGYVNSSEAVKRLLNCKAAHPVIKRLGPKYYCAVSGAATFTIPQLPFILRIVPQILGALIGFLTPVLDVHCTPEEFQNDFTVDPNMHPVAVFTEKRLGSWKYFGLPGVLCQGVNSQVFSRIKNDPERFCKGMAKLLIFSALVISLIGIIASYWHLTQPFNVFSFMATQGVPSYAMKPLMFSAGFGLPGMALVIS